MTQLAAGADTFRYSVVVPVYGNEPTLGLVIRRVEELAESLPGELEVVFVVDGSPDGSAQVLRRLLPLASVASQLIVHSRNFGSFEAIRTGLAASRGELVAAMAADLQEPVELIHEFFTRLATQDCDVVVGRRTSRDDPRISMLLSRLFWATTRRFVHRDLPLGGVDVFACTRVVAEHLIALEESHSSLVGLLYWLGFRRAEVPYVRAARPTGKSAWTLRRKLRYFLDSAFSFTDLPVLLLTAIGLIGAVITAAVGVMVLVARLTGVIDQSGYTPLMLAILFSTFILLIAIGIVGSYVYRTYENSKGRPGAVAMTHEVIDPAGSGENSR